MTEPTQIGDLTRVSYDGYSLTLSQAQGHEPPQEDHVDFIHLETIEIMGLLQFIEDQDTLLKQRLESITRRAAVVSPEWKYVLLYRSWRYVIGSACVYLEPRVFCDRGNWIATVSGIGSLDWQDEFPRYFMDLERAQLEMQQWLTMRMERYEDTEVNRKLEAKNRVRELRDALLRLAPHITAHEDNALAAIYEGIAARVAPGLDR